MMIQYPMIQYHDDDLHLLLHHLVPKVANDILFHLEQLPLKLLFSFILDYHVFFIDFFYSFH